MNSGLGNAILVGIITGTISGAFSAGMIYGILKTELRWLRRDVDMAHERIDALEG